MHGMRYHPCRIGRLDCLARHSAWAMFDIVAWIWLALLHTRLLNSRIDDSSQSWASYSSSTQWGSHLSLIHRCTWVWGHSGKTSLSRPDVVVLFQTFTIIVTLKVLGLMSLMWLDDFMDAKVGRPHFLKNIEDHNHYLSFPPCSAL